MEKVNKNKGFKFLSPVEYGKLVFKAFFKAISLKKETKDWGERKSICTFIQISTYSTAISYVILFFILLLPNTITPTTLLQYITYLLLPFIFSLIMGVSGGGTIIIVGIGIILFLVVSCIGNISNRFDNILGFIYSIALSAIVGGVIVGGSIIDRGIVIFCIGAIIGSIVGGILIIDNEMDIKHSLLILLTYEISYFIFLGRYFYYPFLLKGLIKKIKLQKQPFSFDENIALPIPFLSNILLKQSEYDQESTTAFCMDLIQNRKVHRKQAQKGLIKIAVRVMKNFRNMSDLAALKKHLYFLPESETMLPGDFLTSYTKIAELEQDAWLCNSQSNRSTKIIMMRKFLNRLQELEKGFNFSKAKTALPFTEIIICWKKIVEEEIDGHAKRGGLPLPNPFITGAPIHKENNAVFKGRSDIVQTIQKELLKESAAGAILFLGGRRTGKTSTLINLEELLISGIKVIYIDFQDPKVKESLVDFISEMELRIVKSLKPVFLNETKEREPCQTLSQLTRFMESLVPRLIEQNLYILLCFDEYEKIDTLPDEFIKMLDTFRFWVQNLRRWICLFAGSHTLNEAGKIRWNDYLINTRIVSISFLDFDSALSLVQKPIPEYDITFEPEELAPALALRMGCQPFLTQAVMFELTEFLNMKNTKTATASDIEESVQRMFSSAAAYFNNLWEDELKSEEREVLLSIITNKPIPHEKALKSLISKQIIKQSEEGFAFCIPVLQEWIEKHRNIETR